MKYRKFRLKELNQFNDIEFDFTYPLGHAKAGQPLEKVCIIGQSGTGKTSILKLLGSLYTRGFKNKSTKFTIEIEDKNNILKIHNEKGIQTISRTQGGRTTNMDAVTAQNLISNLASDTNVAVMYLPADFLSKNKDTTNTQPNISGNFYSFENIDVISIWNRILDDIKNHKEKERAIRIKIRELSQITDTPAKIIRQTLNELYDELGKLEEIDNNPLKMLANDCLDLILSHFNLKVNTNYSVTEDLSKIDFIKIEDRKGNIIPNGFISTGTMQFILSSLPFYLLKPNNSVVLFDEPERSLYPNIQKLLVDHYSKFTINSQFFYATHSPIIASCFDPWEVIELKFGDDGYVYQEPYYKEERHVDNYVVHPKYLTYELILKQVFDVQNTDGDDRARKMAEFFMLEDKLKSFKKNGDNQSIEFKETMAKYEKAGNLIFWPNKSEA